MIKKGKVFGTAQFLAMTRFKIGMEIKMSCFGLRLEALEVSSRFLQKVLQLGGKVCFSFHFLLFASFSEVHLSFALYSKVS